MKKPVLVVMAAGMGSRFGGLKQIEPVGSQGEALLDYTLYDAYEAGFETAVIIIKKAIEKDFMETVGVRLAKCPLQIRYAYQELDMLPEGFQVPEGRTKPWGTSHAVLCAKEAIDGAPAAVLNADDYYGKSAFRVLYDYLAQAQDGDKYDFSMVGYQLDKTVTDHGSVARGICQVDDNDDLISVVERIRIEKHPGGIHFTEDGGESWTELDPQVTVSMNMWGLTAGFWDELEKTFPIFLEQNLPVNPLKCEFLLPMSVGHLVNQGKANVKVLHSADKWYGVTYAADKPLVVAALQKLTREGKYPDGLWK